MKLKDYIKNKKDNVKIMCFVGSISGSFSQKSVKELKGMPYPILNSEVKVMYNNCIALLPNPLASIKGEKK